MARTDAAVEGRRQVRGGAQLMVAMLKGSVAWAHVTWLMAIGIGLVLAQLPGGLNAAFGGALVVLFFASGQSVHVLAAALEPRSAMALILTSYALRCAALGLLLWVALHSQSFLGWFRPVPFLVGCLLVLTGWLAGMFWVHARTRIPVYDQTE